MGFLRYFSYSHPILNFFFQNPNDDIKGFRRRIVILTIILLSFTSAVVIDELVFADEEDANTSEDMKTLTNDQKISPHLWATVISTLVLYVIDWGLSIFYSLPDKKICSYPCCVSWRWSIRFHALSVLIFNVIIYAALLRGKSQLFAGWAITYGIYSLIIAPIVIVFKYFLCGGKHQEHANELEENLQRKDLQLTNAQQKHNAMSFV